MHFLKQFYKLIDGLNDLFPKFYQQRKLKKVTN